MTLYRAYLFSKLDSKLYLDPSTSLTYTRAGAFFLLLALLEVNRVVNRVSSNTQVVEVASLFCHGLLRLGTGYFTGLY